MAPELICGVIDRRPLWRRRRFPCRGGARSIGYSSRREMAWELPHACLNRTVRAGTSDPHRRPIKRAARRFHFRRQGSFRCRGPTDRGWQSRLGALACRPDHHAWDGHRLLDAGATLIGKTITDEVSLGILGENAFDGTPLNPKAPDRVPGGSSSGSASAVACGLCDTALGTDTGGSVRVPASFCGLYGIRPTHGRLPLDGMLPQAPSSDTAGWFARDSATFARVRQVMLGEDLPRALPKRLII